MPILIDSVVVQRATYLRHEDLPAIRSLFGELSSKKGDLSHERVNSLIRTCGGPLTFFAALDQDRDGHVVGMASLLELHCLQETRGLIEDVAVDRQYRRRGIGRALIEKTIETARQKRYAGLALTSNANRKAAHKLYASLGFKLRDTNNWRLALT